MAKEVAARWLQGASRSEYRFSIFGFVHPMKAKKFASLLRSIRNRRVIASSDVGSIPTIPDLGVKERGDTVEVWSSNVDGLRKLSKWAEQVGLNTDFIW